MTLAVTHPTSNQIDTCLKGFSLKTLSDKILDLSNLAKCLLNENWTGVSPDQLNRLQRVITEIDLESEDKENVASIENLRALLLYDVSDDKTLSVAKSIKNNNELIGFLTASPLATRLALIPKLEKDYELIDRLEREMPRWAAQTQDLLKVDAAASKTIATLFVESTKNEQMGEVVLKKLQTILLKKFDEIVEKKLYGDVFAFSQRLTNHVQEISGGDDEQVNLYVNVIHKKIDDELSRLTDVTENLFQPDELFNATQFIESNLNNESLKALLQYFQETMNSKFDNLNDSHKIFTFGQGLITHYNDICHIENDEVEEYAHSILDLIKARYFYVDVLNEVFAHDKNKLYHLYYGVKRVASQINCIAQYSRQLNNPKVSSQFKEHCQEVFETVSGHILNTEFVDEIPYLISILLELTQPIDDDKDTVMEPCNNYKTSIWHELPIQLLKQVMDPWIEFNHQDNKDLLANHLTDFLELDTLSQEVRFYIGEQLASLSN